MGEWDDKNLFFVFMDFWFFIKKVGIFIFLVDFIFFFFVKVLKFFNWFNLSFDFLYYFCNVRMSCCLSLCIFFNC